MLVARRAGALEIVVTDLTDGTLQFARRIGADRTVNTSSNPDALASYTQGKGYFDVAFEASGATSALRNCIETVRPGGVIVQLGLGGGDMSVPMQMVTAKELQLRGSFRFHEEFAVAVDYIDKGMIDVNPLISATLPFTQSVRGIRARERSVQVDESATSVLARSIGMYSHIVSRSEHGEVRVKVTEGSEGLTERPQGGVAAGATTREGQNRKCL